ncbi:hypothetical protein YPPY91_1808, partial [Yersinia pestis PY-91]
MPAEYL